MDMVTLALARMNGGGVAADDALSAESTNPVQNRVVKAALDAVTAAGTRIADEDNDAVYGAELRLVGGKPRLVYTEL